MRLDIAGFAKSGSVTGIGGGTWRGGDVICSINTDDTSAAADGHGVVADGDEIVGFTKSGLGTAAGPDPSIPVPESGLDLGATGEP